ncbi:hypothetical protein FRC12_000717 [Ceratobasidium sp. 428]|nr:hypothetical protein FRC12_000717 [Ceratobasidium sp. 428]
MGIASDIELDFESDGRSSPAPASDIFQPAGGHGNIFGGVQSATDLSDDEIVNFVGTCCEEFELSDSMKEDVLKTSRLPMQLLLIRMYARLASTHQQVQQSTVSSFLVSADFKEHITRRLQCGLLDPENPFFVRGTTDRFVRHMTENPVAYKIPEAVRRFFLHSKPFRSAVGGVFSNTRGEFRRKIIKANADGTDIYTLCQALGMRGFQFSEAHALKISYARMYFVEYSTMEWGLDEKRPPVWTWVDSKYEKLYQLSAKKRAKALKANFAADKAMFPVPASNIRAFPKVVMMPQWQADSAAAVAALIAYGVDTTPRATQQDHDDAADDAADEEQDNFVNAGANGGLASGGAQDGENATGSGTLADDEEENETSSGDGGAATPASQPGSLDDAQPHHPIPPAPGEAARSLRPGLVPQGHADNPRHSATGPGPVRNTPHHNRVSPVGTPTSSRPKKGSSGKAKAVASSAPKPQTRSNKAPGPAGTGGTGGPSTSRSQSQARGLVSEPGTGSYDPATSETAMATIGTCVIFTILKLGANTGSIPESQPVAKLGDFQPVAQISNLDSSRQSHARVFPWELLGARNTCGPDPKIQELFIDNQSNYHDNINLPFDYISKKDYFYEPVSVLHLRGVAAPWRSSIYHKLTELRLEELGGVAPSPTQIEAVLAASPSLRSLALCTMGLVWEKFNGLVPCPIPLNDLEVLNLGTLQDGGLNYILRLIAPGPRPLSMSIAPETRGGRFHKIVEEFFERSNVTGLFVKHAGFEIWCPLPQPLRRSLEVLVVDNCRYFPDEEDPDIILTDTDIQTSHELNIRPKLRAMHVLATSLYPELLAKVLASYPIEELWLSECNIQTETWGRKSYGNTGPTSIEELADLMRETIQTVQVVDNYASDPASRWPFIV